MSDIAAEISTDYDLDAEMDLSADSLDMEFGQDLDQLDQEMQALSMFDSQIDQLVDVSVAIENFGMNPTTFGVMSATGLLAGTSLQSMGTENFSFDAPEGLETQMAMEAMVDKIKETSAAWAAKIVTFAKSMSEKVLGGLNAMWDKIAEQSKVLTAKAWDTAKATGATIKAHPYKTVFAALAAAAAVVGIIAMIASGMPGAYANESALKSFMYKVGDAINKINWPFGQLKATVAEDGSRIVCNISAGEKLKKMAASANKLGWSQTATKAVSAQVGKIWAALKTGVTSVGSTVGTVAAKVGKFGGNEMGDKVKEKVTAKTKSGLAGWASGEVVKKIYNTALWAVVGVVYTLLRNIVIKAFRMVQETFASLRPAAAAA